MSSYGAGTDRVSDQRIAALCTNCMEMSAGNRCTHCGSANGGVLSNILQLPSRTILNRRYVTGRVLGQGGFGITYLAFDLQQSRRVAIKEYFPQAVASREAGRTSVISISECVRQDFDYGLQRFMEEARVLSLF